MKKTRTPTHNCCKFTSSSEQRKKVMDRVSDLDKMIDKNKKLFGFY